MLMKLAQYRTKLLLLAQTSMSAQLSSFQKAAGPFRATRQVANLISHVEKFYETPADTKIGEIW